MHYELRDNTIRVTLYRDDLGVRERRWVTGAVDFTFRVRNCGGQPVAAEMVDHLDEGQLENWQFAELADTAVAFAQGVLDGRSRPDKALTDHSSRYVTYGPYYDEGVLAGRAA